MTHDENIQEIVPNIHMCMCECLCMYIYVCVHARGCSKETTEMAAPLLGGKALLCVRERKYPEASGNVQSRENKQTNKQTETDQTWPVPGKWKNHAGYKEDE